MLSSARGALGLGRTRPGRVAPSSSAARKVAEVIHKICLSLYIFDAHNPSKRLCHGNHPNTLSRLYSAIDFSTAPCKRKWVRSPCHVRHVKPRRKGNKNPLYRGTVISDWAVHVRRHDVVHRGLEGRRNAWWSKWQPVDTQGRRVTLSILCCPLRYRIEGKGSYRTR